MADDEPPFNPHPSVSDVLFPSDTAVEVGADDLGEVRPGSGYTVDGRIA
ncbi:hypothetical protein B005_1350 [Nocardiopsis alba ATCC BAA-2165]|uniref:Uncharacterized protein n=1 Tax=Nocardiopsis alba (strain ATCC BAA-2165 / BE74) TaxID=1205910 RepID=J7L5D6_NOCAA|nr:hypothetical protein B005_1350 [Nocardiopsis alba ATCC BAA-2165]